MEVVSILKKKISGERFVPGQIIDTEFGPRFVPGKISEVDGEVTFTPAQIVLTDQGTVREFMNINKMYCFFSSHLILTYCRLFETRPKIYRTRSL